MTHYNFVPYGETLMWCDSEKLGDACFLSKDYFNSYTAVYYPGVKFQNLTLGFNSFYDARIQFRDEKWHLPIISISER